jgi:hypothetical protein
MWSLLPDTFWGRILRNACAGLDHRGNHPVSSLLDPYNPLTWLFGSLAVAVITTNLAWLVGRLGKRSRAGSAILRWSGLPAVGWLFASLFFLVPPVAAWRYGALSPYLMGLTELDWVEDLGSGGPLTALIVGLLLFGWLVYRHYLPPGRSPGRGERLGRTLRAPVDAGLRQWHWAFYRALVIGLLPTAAGRLPPVSFVSSLAEPLVAQSVYWGSWLGLALIGVEWVLNPFARASLRRPIRREAALRRVVLAIATTALFTLTRNFWLCLACDVVVETAIAGWFSLPE